MALKTILNKLNKAREAYEKTKAEIGSEIGDEIGKSLKPLIPTGWRLKWTQYTPYFNDGESCTFGVNDPYLVKESEEGDTYEDGEDEDGEDEDGEDEDNETSWDLSTAIKRYGKLDEEESYETYDYSKPIRGKSGEWEKKTETYTNHGFPKIEGSSKTKLQELRDAFKELPEDLMESAFGDHAVIFINSEGKVSVEEYEHE